MKKRYFKKENAILLYFEGLSDIIFCVIYTLKEEVAKSAGVQMIVIR